MRRRRWPGAIWLIAGLALPTGAGESGPSSWDRMTGRFELTRRR